MNIKEKIKKLSDDDCHLDEDWPIICSSCGKNVVIPAHADIRKLYQCPACGAFIVPARAMVKEISNKLKRKTV